MKTRGRDSAASLSVVPTRLEVIERPSPPSELGEEQTQVWRSIVGGHPADWFDAGGQRVLAQLCRHIVIGNRIAEMIERTDSVYDLMMFAKEQRLESDLIRRLAMTLRITPQSLTNHRGNKKAFSGSKPWEA